MDSAGDGCAWYEQTEGYCAIYGNDYGSPVTANEACCYCGGGSTGGQEGGCT